jgi:Zn finger protein HypA/HybF involved in hydrogenase expression
VHEAGLAVAIAEALREERLDGARIRLLVTGGYAEAADFDQALRLHLAAAASDLDVTAIEIVHLPASRLCVGCGGEFAAVSTETPCPRCGGSALPIHGSERIELEWTGRPAAPEQRPAGQED